MATVDGSSTIFRGAAQGVSELHEVVVTMPLKSGEHVYKGQALSLDQDTDQASSPTAGFDESGDSNGVVQKTSDETSAYFGVALADVDDSAGDGDKQVPVLLRGITMVRCVVNDLDNADGFEKPIKVGDPALFGGSNNTVSGFTSLEAGAYAHAGSSTDGSSDVALGWFLDSQDGASGDDVISNGTTTIADGQQDDTWVRVYVDMPASWQADALQSASQ